MAFESLGSSEQLAHSQRSSASQPLSQTGQMIGWIVYGALLVIGLAIGIVSGTERSKPATVARAVKDKDETKPETAKSDTPKSTPKAAPETPAPTSTPKETPKSDPKPPTPTVTTTPKVDPKPPTPAVTTTMPKTDPKPPMPDVASTPKVDPKPPMPVVTTPPKTDPPAKKEDLKAVSFKTDVLPILRTYCLNCHGAGKGKPKGDVDLTTIEKILKSPGKMLVPGSPEKSDIYASITDGRMPDGGKAPPNKDEMTILKNWILTGAKERRRVVRKRKTVPKA